MGVIRVKPGATFATIDAAGFRILGSLDRVARDLPFDLTVTSATDSHAKTDPHTLGRAYDVRTKNLTGDQKAWVLRAVMIDLQLGHRDAPIEVPGVGMMNLATAAFYGQLEFAGQANEHLHFQQRKGSTFPVRDAAMAALNA